MKKVKVLQYFWGKLDAGGAEALIVNLFREIDRDTFDIDFLVYENKKYFYSNIVEELGGHIVPLAEIESSFLPLRLVQRWINLYKLLKKNKYDVFHCNCDFSLKFVELAIAKKTGIPIRVCHSHNSSLDTTSFKGKISYYVHRLFRPLLSKYATDLLACSTEAGTWLYGNNVPNNRITIINNGIDSQYYSYDEKTRTEMRHKLDVNNQLVLGNIGRFTPIKNQKFMVDIAVEARKQSIPVKVVLIGDGDLKFPTEEYAKACKVEDIVCFVGTTTKVRDYLMAFDCFVMPSLFEGLPVSGIEAQASGVACVVSNSVSAELDLTGNIKFVSLSAGPAAWLQQIVLWHSQVKRTDTSEKIIACDYDIKNLAQKIEKIYRR